MRPVPEQLPTGGRPTAVVHRWRARAAPVHRAGAAMVDAPAASPNLDVPGERRRGRTETTMSSTTAPTDGPTTGSPTSGAPAPASTPAQATAGDAGMATAEYAIATLAACGFAALLVTILASDAVRGLLLGIVQRALSIV